MIETSSILKKVVLYVYSSTMESRVVPLMRAFADSTPYVACLVGLQLCHKVFFRIL